MIQIGNYMEVKNLINIPYKLVYILDSECNIIENEYLKDDYETNKKINKIIFNPK